MIGLSLPELSSFRLSSPTICNLAVDLLSTLWVDFVAKANIASAKRAKLSDRTVPHLSG